jgi:hypothetical protein
MKSLFSFGIIMATLLVTSCGGSGDTILNPGGGPLNIPDAASIQLVASSSQLPSDQFGLTTVTITAIAKDSNNNVISGIPIIFGADNNGSLVVDPVVAPFTNSFGFATAELSNSIGDARNRTINVTATDGNVSASTSVDVVGTTLTVSGPAALAQNDTAPYTIILADAGGAGISGENVTVTSANGNAINPPSINLVTGVDGDVQFALTASQPGSDTVTATGLGMTATQAVSVSGDSFAIIAPAANAELELVPAPAHTVTAHWSISGTPQANQQISFNSTRGMLSVATAMTNASGDATVTISSTTAGPAQITATIDSTGTTTGLPLEFVATTPNTLTIQASPTTVAVNEQSVISVVVRDAQFNLVKNQNVDFLIVADDSFGQLSVGSALTDSQGRAEVFYTAGPVSGSPNGVTISATVRGTMVTGSVNLTVARKELDLVIGTGNEIFSPTSAVHAQEWNVLVTDAVGNAVENSVVQVSLRSINYYKGFLVILFGPPSQWGWNTMIPAGVHFQCLDEDFNRSGSLDIAPPPPDVPEDVNMSGQLEAGNVALVAAVPPGASPADPCATAGASGTSADVITNSQGLARVCVIWPQNFSWWVDAQIEARASVSGTEFSAQQVFLLPALSEDINDISGSPPNQFSPFGPTADCTDPPPGLPFP